MGCHRATTLKGTKRGVEGAVGHSLPAMLAVRLGHPLTSEGMSRACPTNPVSCHPERSEGSSCYDINGILRFAQNDTPSILGFVGQALQWLHCSNGGQLSPDLRVHDTGKPEKTSPRLSKRPLPGPKRPLPNPPHEWGGNKCKSYPCLILPPFMGGVRGGSTRPLPNPKRPLPGPPHEWGGNNCKLYPCLILPPFMGGARGGSILSQRGGADCPTWIPPLGREDARNPHWGAIFTVRLRCMSLSL